ncbi:MAG: hypothetical protein ACYSTF_00570 [Planctomycetota bacterium]|jgi:hypothetical protein
MEYHLYLSLIPEALIASMLPADEFGKYLAVGTQKRAREEAIYLEVNSDFESEYFDLRKTAEHCTPHEDGQPKHTVYISTYRVLEHVPLKVLGNLWLTTPDGWTLVLERGTLPSEAEESLHLYQELCPVHPLIASSLNPAEFCRFITDPNVSVAMPKICFLELQLGNLLKKPWKSGPGNLPYKNIYHLRDCLLELANKKKVTKTVDRIHTAHVRYRCIKGGFFMGDQNTTLYYPFPSRTELEKGNFRWWRSAQLC